MEKNAAQWTFVHSANELTVPWHRQISAKMMLIERSDITKEERLRQNCGFANTAYR